MRAAYIDCTSGAAGDMLLGAFVDAGAPEQEVKDALDSLHLEGWALYFERVTRSGLAATKANVIITRGRRRSYEEIVQLIENSDLGARPKARSLTTFECLAMAEARVHGTDISGVHFHEVGSEDAIVDIVGCSVAIESLALDRIAVSPIATGTGTVPTEHGEFPLPAPAVTEILNRRGATLFGRGNDELITPTGAAILATAADEFGSLPAMTVDGIGYGAGDADREWPNVVRVMVGKAVPDIASEPHRALIIEANIDDMSPELLPHAVTRLLAGGAQDAWVTPIVMKKGRPAFTLSALCSAEDEARIVDVFFKETTTLGLRTSQVDKHVLEREWVEATVEGLNVRVKVGRSNGLVTTVAPEHDDALGVATELGIPLREVYARAEEAARRLIPARDS